MINLAATISKYAPLLASILPIPGGAAIGQVVANAFNGDINRPDILAALIDKDPNAQVKLAEIQANLKVHLEQIAAINMQNLLLAEKSRLDAQTAQMESDRLDRISAREQSKASMMPSVVSFIVLTGFFIIVGLILFFPLSAQESNVMFLLLGTISSAFASVISFWLGSSAGSKIKDNALVESTLVAKAKEVSEIKKSEVILATAQTIAQTAQTTAQTAAAAVQTAVVDAAPTIEVPENRDKKS